MEAAKPKLVALEESSRQEARAPAPAAKRGARTFALLALALAAAALGIGVYAFATAGQESTDDAQVEADVVPVGTRVSGQVARVAVHENQQVKKGDLILQIDDADYLAKVKEAEAQLDTARAQADSADSQVEVVEATAKGGLHSARAAVAGSQGALSSADAQIASARAALERAAAQERKAQVDLSRDQQLRASNSISQGEVDDAQAAYDEARAALQQAQAQLVEAEQQRVVAQSRVAEAQGRLDQSLPIDAQIRETHANAALAHARVKAAEADLDLATLQLSYTKVVAPDDGEVSDLAVHEGQLVQAGQPLVQLVPLYTYVVANFKETQVGRMQVGQRAQVSIDAFPGRTLEARVASLSGGTGARFSLLPPDNASGNFVKVVQRVPVRIEWTQPTQLALRPGLSADVRVLVR